MDKAERWHRPDPPRDAPIRDFKSYAKGPARGASAESDPVSEGVRNGYDVMREQIRQGERLAERLSPGLGRAGAPGLDFAHLLERALDVYKDMGALALAAAETLARNPAMLAGVSRAFRRDAAPGAAPRRADASVAIALQSRRRATVKLDLWEPLAAPLPRVHPLSGADPATPPLVGLRFETDPATKAPVLEIVIDDAQPAGVYAGLVVDAASNAPRGTLSLTIHA